LRILLAPSAYYPHVGGIEELTRQLGLALAARGHETSILTNRWPDGVAKSEVLHGIHVTRLLFPLPAASPLAAGRFLVRSVPAARDLVRHVRTWGPDVVHVIGGGPQAAYLGALADRLGAPLVFTTQGELTFDAHRVFERSVTLRAGLRRIVRKARAVSACSQFALGDLASFTELPEDSSVVPNGVNPDDFREVPAETQGFGRYVLGIGRLVPQKGFDILVEAFGSDAVSALSLVIAGEGFERQSLTARAAELGVDGRVNLLGSVDRIRLARLLHGARVFALPSRGEAFGIALLEAMAAGIPSVAAATGGVTEFARDGVNALLVPPDDPARLADALALLANDEERRERLTAGGRETAEALSWNRIADRYEALYSRVLEIPAS
jgi:glycosyltransferase involved in cell wall biosynthesis